MTPTVAVDHQALDRNHDLRQRAGGGDGIGTVRAADHRDRPVTCMPDASSWCIDLAGRLFHIRLSITSTLSSVRSHLINKLPEYSTEALATACDRVKGRNE